MKTTPPKPTLRKWYQQDESDDTIACCSEESSISSPTDSIFSSFSSASTDTLGSRTRFLHDRRDRPSGISGDSERKRSLQRRKVGRRFKLLMAWKPTEECSRPSLGGPTDLLSPQNYIIKLCRSLINVGAPTHRMEECLRLATRALRISGHFVYLPGCMIIAFDDRISYTTEIKIVRTAPGIHLGKLKDIHDVYRSVLEEGLAAETAVERLDDIMEWDSEGAGERGNMGGTIGDEEDEITQSRLSQETWCESEPWERADRSSHDLSMPSRRRKQKEKPSHSNDFPKWIRVLFYGFASASVAPFAFGGRPVDLPVVFALGLMVGMLQIVVAPRSGLYTNVFEIVATIATSFLARLIGSIRVDGREKFCFSALAQSSVALILPGYLVMCAALEIQAGFIVPGAIRMVHAIVYSLLQGFGITVGVFIYGAISPTAVSSTECTTNGASAPVPLALRFASVAAFTLCLTVINQAKWRQMPFMVIISELSYFVNWYWLQRFPQSPPQLSSMLAALTAGTAVNLYGRVVGSRWWSWVLCLGGRRQGSRPRHGRQEPSYTSVAHPAAAALLPAIFVMVPSGLAATGSLLSGLETADRLNHPGGPSTGMEGQVMDPNAAVATMAGDPLQDLVYNVANSMIQIAIGITVGLFISVLVIYPFGKPKRGLFGF